MTEEKETPFLAPMILGKMMSLALAKGFKNHPIARWLFKNCLFSIDVLRCDLLSDVTHFSDKHFKPAVEVMIKLLESGEDISKKSEPPIDLKRASVRYKGIECSIFFETRMGGEANRIYFDIRKETQSLTFL